MDVSQRCTRTTSWRTVSARVARSKSGGIGGWHFDLLWRNRAYSRDALYVIWRPNQLHHPSLSFCPGQVHLSTADAGIFEADPITLHNLLSQVGDNTIPKDSYDLPPVDEVSRHRREQWVVPIASYSYLSQFGPEVVGGFVQEGRSCDRFG